MDPIAEIMRLSVDYSKLKAEHQKTSEEFKNRLDKLESEIKFLQYKITTTDLNYETPNKQSKYKCVIVGDEECGKTTYLKRLSTGIFDTKYIPTLGADSVELEFNVITGKGKNEKITFECIELSGNHDSRELRMDSYKSTDCIIFMYDGSYMARNKINQWKHELGNQKSKVLPVLNHKNNIIFDDETMDGTVDINVKTDFGLRNPFMILTQKLWNDDNLIFEEEKTDGINKEHMGLDFTDHTTNTTSKNTESQVVPDLQIDFALLSLDGAKDQFYEIIKEDDDNIIKYTDIYKGQKCQYVIRNFNSFPPQDFHELQTDFIIVFFDWCNPNAHFELTKIAKFIKDKFDTITHKSVKVLVIGINNLAKYGKMDSYDTKPKTIQHLDFEEIFDEYYFMNINYNSNIEKINEHIIGPIHACTEEFTKDFIV